MGSSSNREAIAYPSPDEVDWFAASAAAELRTLRQRARDASEKAQNAADRAEQALQVAMQAARTSREAAAEAAAALHKVVEAQAETEYLFGLRPQDRQ